MYMYVRLDWNFVSSKLNVKKKELLLITEKQTLISLQL